MEKSDFISIINYHYDSLLSQINAEADFQTPKDDKQEDFIEIKGNIDIDRKAFIEEINKSRDANIKQLDSNPDLIKSLNLEDCKEKLFQNSYCLFFPKQYVPEFYGTAFGFLIKSPFFIRDSVFESTKYKLLNFVCIFFIFIFLRQYLKKVSETVNTALYHNLTKVYQFFFFVLIKRNKILNFSRMN